MKVNIRNFFSLSIPLLIGLVIIYYQYTTLTVEEIEKIKISFVKADYFYIFLSLFIALLGFWSRAYRWKFALQHLGYKTQFRNNLMTVCISYLVNLTLPRSGEISRAALIKKYENVPFDKGFGTIIAERIIDLILFLFFVVIAFILQFNKLYGFLIKKLPLEKIIYLLIGGGVVFIIFVFVWIYAEWKMIEKLKQKLSGLIEGMMSVLKMKDKWNYLFHSFFIWFTYLLMFYVTIFSLPETSDIGFDVVIMGFIFGSLAVGFTNGGIGAYPLAIALIYSLYGIPNEVGVAFGWLVWTSQTLLTIFLGLLSYLLLPILNKK